MPLMTHEGLALLFRHNPSLATTLVGARMPVPDHAQVQIDDAALGDIAPTEYRADAVVTIRDQAGALMRALVTEIQLGRDNDKRYTWPVYIASLRARLRCPVNLMVIAVDPALADWCAQPIDLGDQGFVLKPWVIGPQQVPVVTDSACMADIPELGILSVAAHRDEPGAEHIAFAAIEAVHRLDNQRAHLYADLVYYFLGTAARAALETLMQSGNYEYKSDFAREYFSKGHAQGRAQGLLLALKLANYVVPTSLREHILQCTDVPTLDTWYERAKTAHALDDIFDRTILDQS